MGFVTQRGVFVVDPYTTIGRIVLSHPDCPHALVLACVAEEQGYQPAIDGWNKADGRSLTGGIRVAGRYQNPVEELQCSFLVSELQIQLFDWLKRLQDNTQTQITCQDWIQKVSQAPGATAPTWLAGSPTTNAIGLSSGYQSFGCWIDTDRGYKTPNVGNLWWVLQLQILRG